MTIQAVQGVKLIDSRPDDRIIEAFSKIIEGVCEHDVTGTIGFSRGVALKTRFSATSDRVTVRPGMDLRQFNAVLGDEGYFDTFRWCLPNEFLSYSMNIFDNRISLHLPPTSTGPAHPKMVLEFDDGSPRTRHLSRSRGATSPVVVRCGSVDELVEYALEALLDEKSLRK